MRHGVAIFLTDDTPGPAAVARLAEDAGFDALYVTEHTHIPAERRTPWPGGEDLPPEYLRTYDPFVALAAAAAATTTLRLGTGVALIPQRHPVTTAKEVATLDRISGGRLDLGIGAGWNLEELRNHGVDPARRFSVMREHVEAMRAIWTQDEASYAGEHVRFDRIWSWPKPVQRPHPPILVGGNGPRVLDRVLRYGDGWLPNPEPGGDDVLLTRVADLRARAADAGREVTVVASSVAPDPARIARLREGGVDQANSYLPPAGRDAIERRLEELRAAIDDAG